MRLCSGNTIRNPQRRTHTTCMLMLQPQAKDLNAKGGLLHQSEDDVRRLECQKRWDSVSVASSVSSVIVVIVVVVSQQ